MQQELFVWWLAVSAVRWLEAEGCFVNRGEYYVLWHYFTADQSLINIRQAIRMIENISEK